MERPVCPPPPEPRPRECYSCRFYLLTFPLKVRAFPETLVFVTVVHGKLQARRNILIGSHVRMYIRGFTKFGIKVLWRLQFREYLGTLRLKFQKARTKIEVVLSLPCWLSQLNWDSQQSRGRKTSILVRAFWNFKLKVLKYPRNCRLYATLILKVFKKSWIG